MDLDALDAHRGTVTTSHGSVSYLDMGEGPTALFVHGVGTNAFLWRHMLQELAPARRCIAIDLPGHGGSDPIANATPTIGVLADVVNELRAALELDQVDLVANDTGGAVAQIFAARHPESLRSLVLTNCEAHDNIPPAAFQPTVDLAKQGLVALAAEELLADLEVARATIFGMGYEDIERLPLEVVRSFLEPVLGTPERARVFEQLLAALDPAELLAVEPALRELEVPTLIVWGTGDEFFELRWASWLRDLIPGVTDVVEIAGAKLFFPDERGTELAEHVRRHWADVAATRAA